MKFRVPENIYARVDIIMLLRLRRKLRRLHRAHLNHTENCSLYKYGILACLVAEQENVLAVKVKEKSGMGILTKIVYVVMVGWLARLVMGEGVIIAQNTDNILCNALPHPH